MSKDSVQKAAQGKSNAHTPTPDLAGRLIRVHKYLAQCGVASRRHAEKLIAARRVTVNGKTVEKPATFVDPSSDEICVDGRAARPERKIYLLLNKPRGYVTTARDPHGRQTVTDLLRDVGERVFPVGRLDRDVSGLLIMTNDGELAYRLTHPRFHVEKTYRAEVKGVPSRADLRRLERGVKLDEKVTAPARARIVSRDRPNVATVELVVHEGRKNQVKRMLAAVGHEVIMLTRTEMAGLKLGRLAVGQYKKLTRQQVQRLHDAAGNAPE